ncbi:hypothetical protein ACFL1I_06470 [Candidatus Omnitrophota bacterium]
MNKPKESRKQIFSNTMHRELFLLFFSACVIPALIAVIAIVYLIFDIMAEQLMFPEAVTYNIGPVVQKVLMVFMVAVPLSIVLMLIFALNITHKIVGPFDRIVRELSDYADGKKKDQIRIREGDKFFPLVNKVNILIERLNKQ